MSLRSLIFLLAPCFLSTTELPAQTKEPLRIEPPHWWTSMPSNELTLILHEDGIASWTPSIREKSLRLKEVLSCDHPDYLWITLVWDATFKASTFDIQLSREGQIREVPYTFKAKDRHFRSSGLHADDAVYVIHPDRFANGDPANDRSMSSLLNRRDPGARHGGDLEGVRQHLDYIRSVGTNVVHLYPIEEAKGSQPPFPESAVTDHFKVDPRYGDTASYRRLVQRLHQLNMKIVKDIDLAFAGPEHHLIRDLPFPNWLAREQQTMLSKGKQQIAWNTSDPLLRHHLIQMTLWWMEEFKLDALCLDHYALIDRSFADQLILEVESAYPGVTIYANIPEFSPEQLSQSTLTRRDRQANDPALRYVVNYPLHEAVDAMFTSSSGEAGMDQLQTVLLADDLYLDPSRQINFLDDRRTTRWFGRQDRDLNKYKAGLAVLATVRGIPSIYYGTEIQMKQTKHPGKVSEDFPGGWQRDRRNKFIDRGRKKKEQEAFRITQRFLTWRTKNPAVTRGTLVSYPPKAGLYTYFRRYGESLVMVVINGNRDRQDLVLDPFQDTIRGYGSARDILTGAVYSLDDPWSLTGFESRVLELER